VKLLLLITDRAGRNASPKPSFHRDPNPHLNFCDGGSSQWQTFEMAVRYWIGSRQGSQPIDNGVCWYTGRQWWSVYVVLHMSPPRSSWLAAEEPSMVWYFVTSWPWFSWNLS